MPSKETGQVVKGGDAMDVVSPTNPRLLERVSDGERARVTDQGEYVSMTTGQGYRDVTDDPAPRDQRPVAGVQRGPAVSNVNTSTAGGSTS